MNRISSAHRVPAFTTATALALWAIAAVLAGCIVGGGTDVGNPDLVAARVSGSLLQADGTPAPWVHIRLRPKTFLSNPDSLQAADGKAIQDRLTDTQGFFSFDSVPKGDYRIQAFDTASQGVTREFTVDGNTPRMTLASATMGTTGAITGKVAYLGSTKAGFPKIYIAVFGIDRWTIANEAGDYTLSDLPQGEYSLSITTTVNATVFSTKAVGIILPAGGEISAGTVNLGP
ncbi:MAG: hypothetical protein ABIW76_01095 [Fibrobacteria bacterium]